MDPCYSKHTARETCPARSVELDGCRTTPAYQIEIILIFRSWCNLLIILVLRTPLGLSGMPREAEPSINERAFILEALQENIRLDGRPLDAFRELHIAFGEEYGVADVQLARQGADPSGTFASCSTTDVTHPIESCAASQPA